MKVAGLMRVADFPLFPVMLNALCLNPYLTHLVLAFDDFGYRKNYQKNLEQYKGENHYTINGFEWFSLISENYIFPQKLSVDLYKSEVKGVGGLEEMLRRLDQVKPDYVFLQDSDEKFDYKNGWNSDFEEFTKSGADVWRFSFITATDDKRYLPPFPRAPHCKAFKWSPDVTFRGSHGFCEPVYSSGRIKKPFSGKTKILHFPFFTKSMQEQRLTMYGPKHPLAQYKNA
tara:strand:- start:430 stop:1116 length:687 start_codon:yes stop_codon:yes gene_type:complete